MKNNTTFLSIIIGILLVLLVMTYIKSCSKDNSTVPKVDTTLVVKHDTIFGKPQPIVDVPSYKPGTTVYYPIYVPRDVIDTSKTDYQQLLDLYWNAIDSLRSTNYTNDKIVLNDSTGRNVGEISIADSVRDNHIIDRKIDYQLQFPTLLTTKIITISGKEVKRNMLFIGANLQGNKYEFINGAGVDFLFKNKKESLFGAGIVYNTYNNQVSYILHKYWKIGKNK